jgi:hypothetical protein
MRSIFVAFICVLSFSAKAGYIDGNTLKAMSVAPVTDNSHLQFVGYVIGAIDSDEQKNICVDAPPRELTPVLDAVINYLATNPEKLNNSGSSLVVEALIPLYSCKKKS